MTNVAYLEYPTGMSGNMCLAEVLLDVGVPLAHLQAQLARLKLVKVYD
ncbi:DUF111 family protein [Synechococcales cyanobacterium C]|uniref:DUF111 family protein n=1 Tax=Petrachloros mirabilis ULC683 TaxID=2781853 RepID=A0A8K2A163_9CYAN|nr:nickel insertion protein [Petrachloros mirabilis]NCJ07721.1 DUF111 family protein [Petrachloros mirabilis ULC683]